MIGRLRQWLLAAAGLAAAVVLGEVAARLYAGHPLWPLVPPKPYIDNARLYRKHAALLYEMTPGLADEVGYGRVRITINRAGFRDDVDPALPKPAGTWRVIVLGDSFTFSGKVPLADTFAKRLEKLLDARDPARRYEVLNLGVPGYKSRQQLDLLRGYGMALQPDLVIVDVTMNFAAAPVQLVPQRPPVWPQLNRWLKRFDLIQSLYASWKQSAFLRQGRLGPAAPHADLAEGSPRWEASQADLGEMQRLAREKGVGLLVVLWPMFVDLDGDYPYAAKHRLVARACERLAIPVVDLLSVFRGHDERTLWASRDDRHPNPAAQQRVAEVVLQDLEARGWLPQRRDSQPAGLRISRSADGEARDGGRGLAR